MFTILKRQPIQDHFNFAELNEDSYSIPRVVTDMMVRTRRLYRFWWGAHYTVGLTGVVAGALLTAITSSQLADESVLQGAALGGLQGYSWLIGIIAAVSTSMVTFLGPLQKAERYYSAFHHLEQACLEYRGIDADPRSSMLMRRVMEARGILQIVDNDLKLRRFMVEDLAVPDPDQSGDVGRA